MTKEWIQKAEEDLSAAKLLNAAKQPVHNAICFHCQQAAEKYLKAMLQETGLPVPRVHGLEQLLSLLLPGDASLRPLRRGLKSLSRYAVEYRYPGMRATARQAQSALIQARRTRDAIRVSLGLST